MIGKLGLSRQEKVKKKQDFNKVFDSGKRYSSALLGIVFTGSQRACRLGIIASRKVGNAVQRNRLKRFIREIFRINKDGLKIPVDLVVILKPAARETTREELQTGFLELCKKARLL